MKRRKPYRSDLPRIPYRGDALQPSRDRISALWKRRAQTYAGNLKHFVKFGLGSTLTGLVAAGVQNLAADVPQLDKGPPGMEIEAHTQARQLPRRFGAGSTSTEELYHKKSGGGAMRMRRGDSGVAGGSTWQGNFRGLARRGTGYASTIRGYNETIKIAGFNLQYGCTYLGITSYPALDSTDTGVQGSGKLCGRVFKDICIAMVRHWFRHFHSGRFEFTTPDQAFLDLFLPPALANANNQNEIVTIQYTDSLGQNLTNNNFSIMVNGLVGNFTNIRDLGNAIAVDIWTKWRLGLYPRFMSGERYGVSNSATVTQGRMSLDQFFVRARCTTVLRVQNQCAAADASTGILDTDANPLQGKIFYFKDIGPSVAAGRTFNNQSLSDAWGELNLSKPASVSASTSDWRQSPYLENVYTSSALSALPSPDVAPTGAWAMLPKAAYFKNCVSEKSVSMEPGVMKQFALRFRFSGRLTDWLRADASNFAQADTPTGSNVLSHAFTRGMGQSAILVVEKRIRDYPASGSTIPIRLAFECDTYIHTDVSHGKSRMTNHVETGFGAV